MADKTVTARYVANSDPRNQMGELRPKGRTPIRIGGEGEMTESEFARFTGMGAELKEKKSSSSSTSSSTSNQSGS